MRLIAIIAAVLLLVVGCSSNDDQGSPAPASTQPSTTPASSEPPSSSTPTAAEEPAGLSAAEVVDAFKAAKLPVRNERNNSASCETQQLGCLELVTTDDVSITTWGDSVAMETYAQAFGKDAFVLRNVVLQYAGARTPATLRPRYQQVLTAIR